MILFDVLVVLSGAVFLAGIAGGLLAWDTDRRDDDECFDDPDGKPPVYTEEG